MPTTPKPLLTLEYGLTWIGTQDWRWLVWLTILVCRRRRRQHGGVVSLVAQARGGRSARRAGDGKCRRSLAAAAAFVTAALLGSSDLMLEVSRANSLVWALAWWSIAGLAVTEAPIRPRLAGVALLLAGLVRFETFAWRSMRLPSGRGGASSHGARIAELASLARRRPSLAGAVRRRGAVSRALCRSRMLHDWLLTGDPFYWLAVPARYTAIFNPGLAPIDPLAYAGTSPAVLRRSGRSWCSRPSASYALVRRSRSGWPSPASPRWASASSPCCSGSPCAATYISNRYYEPIDLALIVARGRRRRLARPGSVVGSLPAGAPTRRGRRGSRPGRRRRRGRDWPALPWDRRATTELSDVRRASAHLAAVMPTLPIAATSRRILAPPASDRRPPRSQSRRRRASPSRRGEPLTRVGNRYAVLLNDGDGGAHAGPGRLPRRRSRSPGRPLSTARDRRPRHGRRPRRRFGWIRALPEIWLLRPSSDHARSGPISSTSGSPSSARWRRSRAPFPPGTPGALPRRPRRPRRHALSAAACARRARCPAPTAHRRCSSRTRAPALYLDNVPLKPYAQTLGPVHRRPRAAARQRSSATSWSTSASGAASDPCSCRSTVRRPSSRSWPGGIGTSTTSSRSPRAPANPRLGRPTPATSMRGRISTRLVTQVDRPGELLEGTSLLMTS